MRIRSITSRAYFAATYLGVAVSDVIRPIKASLQNGLAVCSAFARLPATFDRIADTLDTFARIDRARTAIGCPVCTPDGGPTYIFVTMNKGCCAKCGIHWSTALAKIEKDEKA